MKKQFLLFYLIGAFSYANAMPILSKEIPALNTYLDGELYKTERFYWAEESLDGECHLKTRTWEDKDGKVVKCVIYTYDPYGNQTSETLYGNLSGLDTAFPLVNDKGNLVNANVESYTIFRTYDPDTPNLLISQREDNGKTITYEYDPDTQLKTAEFLGDSSSILQRRFFEYDELNRLIKVITDDGSSKDPNQIKGVKHRSATLFAYDETNQETVANTEENLPHNPAAYHYDALGRLIQVVLPSILDERDCIRTPSIHYKYDILDNVTAVTDENGHTTHMRYTAYGKPFEKCYPDGSKETYIYYLDGSLHKKIDRNGNTTVYQRDLLGRETFNETKDASSQRLSSLASTYSGSQLIKTVQNDQITTLYTYFPNGNISTQQQESADGTQRVHFVYDDNGTKIAKTESWGLNPQDTLVTNYQEDSNGQLINTFFSDITGVILKELPVDISETPQHQFQENIIVNGRGQTVRQTTSTDENGQKLTITYDALDRPEILVTADSFGKIIQYIEVRHDLAGNKTKESFYHPKTHTLIKTNQWTYDSCNRIKSHTEAIGTSSERVTYYVYNSQGQLSEIITPKGIVLSYRYSAGQLADYFASDNSFNYHFIYDCQGRLIRVEDRLHQTVSERDYNSFGQITREQLGNGLKIQNTYDTIGRRTQLVLPDHSLIAFEYDALYLRAVKRYSNKGQLRYTHAYSEYNLQGMINKVSLIGAAGFLDLTYDQTGFCQSIRSPHWSQIIPEEGIDAYGNIVALEGTDSWNQWSSTFSYNFQQELIEEGGPVSHRYAYDSMRNRRSLDDSINHHDTLNQIEATDTAEGRIYYTYDLNGNLCTISSPTGETSYHYDALDRLIRVVIDSDCEIHFVYDAWNRRLSKTIAVWNSDSAEWIPQATHRYLYDGNKEIGAADDSNFLFQLRVLGVPLIGEDQHSDISAAVAYELNGISYAPIHDHRGNVCCLIHAETGEPAESYYYSAFGEMKVFSETGSPLTESQLDTPWLFSSKRYDSETHLIFYGKRYYSPSLGTWLTKDPLGSIDGHNPYLFLQNNPISHIDSFGLFSISAAWKNLKDITSSIANALSHLKNKLSLSNHLGQHSSELTEHVFSKGFLQLAGYYVDPIDSGTTPYGEEINSKVRVTFINGILNIRQDLEETLKLFSATHGNVPIHYVYRPTEGWTKDLVSSALSKMGFTSPYAKLLAKTWKEMIQDMGGVGQGGKIIHYAHSIGAADTYVAKNLLTPEEQQMIHVIAIGSPTMIPQNSGFGNVVNYVSKRDGVCLLDPIGYVSDYFSGQHQTQFVGSLWGVPLIDHTLYTESYGGIIQELGAQFVGVYKN